MNSLNIEKLVITDQNSAYLAVGKFVENCCFWESDLKNLMKKINYDFKNEEYTSLRKMINYLFNKNFILEDHRQKLIRVVELRNYYTHQFLVDFRDANINEYEIISKDFSNANHLVYESRDFILNKYDEVSGINLARRANEIEDN